MLNNFKFPKIAKNIENHIDFLKIKNNVEEQV